MSASPRQVRTRQLTWVGVVAIAAMAVPELVSSFWLRSLLSAVIFALPALGAAVLYDRLRVASLCQVGLAGVGGWVALRVAHGFDPPFLVSVLAGGAAAGMVGVAVGLPALRIRGLYLAMVTLMLAGGVEKVLQATGFPDGGSGALGRDVAGLRTPMGRPTWATTDASYFRFVVVIVAVAFAVVAVLRSDRFGRMWSAIGRSELSAAAAGIDATTVQTGAFALGGVLSGIAGGLLAGAVGFLDPVAFAASESVLLFALMAVAGARSLAGPAVAGLLYRSMPTLFNELGIDGDVATIIFGAALLHGLVTARDGITGQLAAAASRTRALLGRGIQTQTSEAAVAGAGGTP